MCSNCKPRFLEMSEEAFARINKLKEFQQKLFQLGSEFDIDGARKLANECFDFGVKPADFVMGFVSPILGKLTLKHDSQGDQLAHLDEFCQELLAFSRLHLPKGAQGTDPDVLLTVVPGNKHLFGIQFLEMWLASEGIHAFALLNAETPEEILKCCLKYKPKIVGFSISDPEQVLLLDSTSEKIRNALSPAPLLIAGGHAVKYNQVDKKTLKGVSLIADETKLFLTIKTQLSLGFLYDLQKETKKLK